MKAGELIEALERFFLDFVGTVLPGMALLAGFCYVTKTPFTKLSEPLFDKPGEFIWVMIICLSYILGHGITSMGHKITQWLEGIY